jgi:LemA protein
MALIAVPVVVVIGAGAASAFVKVRNGLAQERAAIAAGWTEVDQALEQRAALIHELAEKERQSGLPVDAIAKEIAEAQSDLARGATPQRQIEAHERLSMALARLLEAEDAHRQFKPGPAAGRLEEQIKDSEEKIAVARRRYNETLEHYNVRIQTFPNNLVAKIAGFRRNDAYFRTEPF